MLPYLLELMELFVKVDLDEPKAGRDLKVKRGEEIVGIMSPDLYKFWGMFKALGKTLDEEYKIIGERYCRVISRPKSKASPEDIEFAVHRMLRVRHYKTIEFIFARCVEEEFPDILVDTRSIGVREGGRIVFEKEEKYQKVFASDNGPDPFQANRPGLKGDMHEHGMPQPYRLH